MSRPLSHRPYVARQPIANSKVSGDTSKRNFEIDGDALPVQRTYHFYSGAARGEESMQARARHEPPTLQHIMFIVVVSNTVCLHLCSKPVDRTSYQVNMCPYTLFQPESFNWPIGTMFAVVSDLVRPRRRRRGLCLRG